MIWRRTVITPNFPAAGFAITLAEKQKHVAATPLMPLPNVSSEGGPVLIADFAALRSWRGAFHDSGDYERACDALGNATLTELQVGEHRVIVWDIGGPGTADIVRVSPTHISLVRIWPDASWTEADCERTMISAATERFGPVQSAQLSIHSGYLLALWAPEDMSTGGGPLGDSGSLSSLTVGSGGAYVRVPSGRYGVSACEWQTEVYEVTKIDLRLLS
jgi:hypothetical protein